MTFRTKLFVISSLTVAGAVALVTGAVSVATRRAFERMDDERRTALLQQFESEMKLQGAEVALRVEQAAASDTVAYVSAEAARREPDYAAFYNKARALAETLSLDFLDVTQKDLTILSSAHWPARFGYPNNWASCSPSNTSVCDSNQAFLVEVPYPDGTTAVALAAASRAGNVWVIGARRLDPGFLKALGHAPGMRALLWLSKRDVFDSEGALADPEKLAPLVDEVKQTGRRATRVVQWTPGPESQEAFLALPLAAGGRVVGVLLAGTSLRGQLELERSILWIGILVGGSGILLGVLLGWWTTERVTRPVERLAEGARAVAAGNWSARVEVASRDEIGELARVFNQMTRQLIEQRDRALQAERVAAWRELARRLAHELKNPLFPLQITIENLQRARQTNPEQFDEVFRESAATLLDEVNNLKTIIGRFSDFAKMPAPHFESVDVNQVADGVLKLFQPQLTAGGKIQVAAELTGALPRVEADPEQLRRALSNLVLNAMDAMKDGGTLSVKTAPYAGGVRIEVADTGEGLTEDERARLFTPYYTTKLHGTGLGLAIVQSVVSDHHGIIAVESEPGRGARFLVDLPRVQPSQGESE